MDEHRIGLKPVLQKVWAPQGQRPLIKTYPDMNGFIFTLLCSPKRVKRFGISCLS